MFGHLVPKWYGSFVETLGMGFIAAAATALVLSLSVHHSVLFAPTPAIEFAFDISVYIFGAMTVAFLPAYSWITIRQAYDKFQEKRKCGKENA